RLPGDPDADHTLKGIKVADKRGQLTPEISSLSPNLLVLRAPLTCRIGQAFALDRAYANPQGLSGSCDIGDRLCQGRKHLERYVQQEDAFQPDEPGSQQRLSRCFSDGRMCRGHQCLVHGWWLGLQLRLGLQLELRPNQPELLPRPTDELRAGRNDRS